MSVEQMARVFKHSRSTGAARLVLLALADEAHESGAVTAYKRSQKHLAKKANTDPRTVRRAIRALEELGELEVLKEGDGRESSDYMLTIPDREGDTPAPTKPESGEGEMPTHPGQDAHPGRTTRPPTAGEMPAPSSRSLPVPPVDPGTSAPTATPRRRRREPAKVLDPLTQCADDIARHVWENRDPKPAANFMGVRGVLRRLLDAGWLPEQVQAAAMAVPALTVNAMEFELNRACAPVRGHGSTATPSAAERREARNDAAFDLVLGMVAEAEAARTPTPTTPGAPVLGALDVKELTA